MKKVLTILALMLLCMSSMLGEVHEHEQAVVYYMPKTELVIELGYDVVEAYPGVYYQYAERYLGACDVVLDTVVEYVLTSADIVPRAKADRDRAYVVTAQKGVKNQCVSLSSDGRLLGYNIGAVKEEQVDVNRKTDVVRLSKDCAPMPLLEEQFMATTVAKMAEGAAKQIYRIREARLNLLSGEVEHLPADGEAMALTLEELRRQEEALTALFVGRRYVTSYRYQVVYTPEGDAWDEVVSRFSLHQGVVKNDDLSGEPVYVRVKGSYQQLGEAVVENNKGPVASQLYYNWPGSAEVRVVFKGEELAVGRYDIAQFGVAIPLSAELFVGKDTPIIYINAETGFIQSIEQ